MTSPISDTVKSLRIVRRIPQKNRFSGNLPFYALSVSKYFMSSKSLISSVKISLTANSGCVGGENCGTLSHNTTSLFPMKTSWRKPIRQFCSEGRNTFTNHIERGYSRWSLTSDGEVVIEITLATKLLQQQHHGIVVVHL